MTAKKSTYRLKHYHELKMMGVFDAEGVQTIVESAVAVSLGKLATKDIPQIPIYKLQLFDVHHLDTGTQRTLTKNSDTRVYKSTMITISAPHTSGSFALESVRLDEIGDERRVLKARLSGRVAVDELLLARDFEYAEEIKNVLENQEFPSLILGSLVVGQSFTFGKAIFNLPPNENYDELITIGSFLDQRWENT